MHCFTVLHHESNVSHPSLSISPSVHFHPLIPVFLCSSVTAVRLPDGLSFVVYEFWDGEEEWKRWVLIIFGSDFILNPELYPSCQYKELFIFRTRAPTIDPKQLTEWSICKHGEQPQSDSFPVLIHFESIKSHYWVQTFILFRILPLSQHSRSPESFLELSTPFLLIPVLIDWWSPNKRSSHFSSITATSLFEKKSSNI